LYVTLKLYKELVGVSYTYNVVYYYIIPTTIPAGVVPSTILDTYHSSKAKQHWNFWFRHYNGLEVVRGHVHYLGNHDAIHVLLQTGRFNDITQAGVCFQKERARQFVQKQLNEFLISIGESPRLHN